MRTFALLTTSFFVLWGHETHAQMPSQPTASLPAGHLKGPPRKADQSITGLASLLIRAGTGTVRPTAKSRVTVHYTGWTTDGHIFDSSLRRGRPATFSLDQVIRGWTEGLQLMVKGEKRRLWIPERLAYQGRSGFPAGMLIFDVELIDFQVPPKAPEVPSDVAKVPISATVHRSGLATKVLEKGTGHLHPKATSRVTVHYTGWTTDGRMFDSSIVRGQPVTFSLGDVISGWSEGLQMMVKGEKSRLWTPENLAYQGRSGAPKGMLVFDVELIDIQ